MDRVQEFRRFVIDHEKELFDCSLYEAWQREKNKAQTKLTNVKNEST